VVSGDTTPLYMRPMALHWLSALHIALCWLPTLNIDIVWLPTTRFFITRVTNVETRSDVELQPLNWLPVLHIPCTGSLHGLPASGSTSRGSHKDIFKNETPIRISNFIGFQEIIST